MKTSVRRIWNADCGKPSRELAKSQSRVTRYGLSSDSPRVTFTVGLSRLIRSRVSVGRIRSSSHSWQSGKHRCRSHRRSGSLMPRGASKQSADYPNVRSPIERQRSEEHTSELQSRRNLVCRLLLEKKKKIYIYIYPSISDIEYTNY